MSMIQLHGTLLNTFKAKNREGEEKDKIQLLGDIALPNGEVRKDLMTVSVQDLRDYEGREMDEVSVSVGVFAPQKGTVIFFETRR